VLVIIDVSISSDFIWQLIELMFSLSSDVITVKHLSALILAAIASNCGNAVFMYGHETYISLSNINADFSCELHLDGRSMCLITLNKLEIKRKKLNYYKLKIESLGKRKLRGNSENLIHFFYLKNHYIYFYSKFNFFS
jgi:hypothetical protein